MLARIRMFWKRTHGLLVKPYRLSCFSSHFSRWPKHISTTMPKPMVMPKPQEVISGQSAILLSTRRSSRPSTLANHHKTRSQTRGTQHPALYPVATTTLLYSPLSLRPPRYLGQKPPSTHHICQHTPLAQPQGLHVSLNTPTALLPDTHGTQIISCSSSCRSYS